MVVQDNFHYIGVVLYCSFCYVARKMTNLWDLYEYVKAAKGRPIIAKEFMDVFGERVSIAKLKGFDKIIVEFQEVYDFPNNPYGQKVGYVTWYDSEGKKNE